MVPRDCAFGAALEPGVMRINSTYDFCRKVQMCWELGFASLSQAGELALCQPSKQCRAMPAESSVLFSAAKTVLCPAAAGRRASPEFRKFGKVQTSWPQLPSVYRLAWQHLVLCVLLALVCALLARKLCIRATPAMSFGVLYC